MDLDEATITDEVCISEEKQQDSSGKMNEKCRGVRQPKANGDVFSQEILKMEKKKLKLMEESNDINKKRLKVEQSMLSYLEKIHMKLCVDVQPTQVDSRPSQSSCNPSNVQYTQDTDDSCFSYMNLN